MTMTGGLKQATGLMGQKTGVKKLSPGEMVQVGAFAIQTMRQRVVTHNRNLADASAKPYSAHGPIYMPMTGVKGQTKTGVKGRDVITPQLRRAAREAGTAGHSLGRSRSGRSLKFADGAAYKRYLGKSGNRDLEVSGAVLRAAQDPPGRQLLRP